MSELHAIDSVPSPLVATDNPVPAPPFRGARRLQKIPMRAVLPYINRNTLLVHRALRRSATQSLQRQGIRSHRRSPAGIPRATGRLTDPQRYCLVVETGDEVLDCRLAIRDYAAACQLVLGSGDHSFQHWQERIDSMLAFAGVAVVHPETASR